MKCLTNSISKLLPLIVAIFTVEAVAQSVPAQRNTEAQEFNSLDFREYAAAQGLLIHQFRPRSPDASIQTQRQRAVNDAWEQEHELLKKTGQGTHPWTEAEKKELLETGKVKGYHGHHINSVNGHPEQAANPNNIKFARAGKDHLQEHGGNNRNQTSGKLIDRQHMIRVYEKVVRAQYAVGGAIEVGGGILLLAHFGPEAYSDLRGVINPQTRCARAWLELGYSGSMTASGAGFTASGSARVIAFALARAQVANMHRYLSPLATFSKAAGVFAIVTAAAAEGFYGYEWYEGYISTPVFVTKTSGLAAATAGGIAGGAAGGAIGGIVGGPAAPVTVVVGGAIGGLAGGMAGYWGGTYAASSYYERLDEESKVKFTQYIYAKYS